MSYTVNGTTYDCNSSVNQKIKGELVRREVRACVTDMVEDLMEAEVDGWAFDDFENATYLRCSMCYYGSLRDATPDDIAVYNEGREEEDRICPEDYGCGLSVCKDCGALVIDSDCELDYAEPMEYWIVTPWLGCKLQEHNEMTMGRYGGWVWGRQTTGQAISLDYVISDIAQSMEILDGQQNSWADMV